MVLASLRNYYQCKGFQNVQTIQSERKNGFPGFHTSYCNALSKIKQTEKAKSTKHHLIQKAFMERK